MRDWLVRIEQNSMEERKKSYKMQSLILGLIQSSYRKDSPAQTEAEPKQQPWLWLPGEQRRCWGAGLEKPAGNPPSWEPGKQINWPPTRNDQGCWRSCEHHRIWRYFATKGRKKGWEWNCRGSCWQRQALEKVWAYLEPGSVEAALQARTHRASVCVPAKSLQSCPLFEALWAVALQAPLSMGFSKQEYRSSHSLFQGSSRPRNRNWVSCIAGPPGRP